MKIQFYSILLTALFVIQKSDAQNVKSGTAKNILEVIEDLSFFWKMDSLGTNGFRSCSAKSFLKAKIIDITEDVIVLKLGKPTRISYDTGGDNYIYNIYDGKLVNETAKYTGVIRYLNFHFDKSSKKLLGIGSYEDSLY